MALITTGVITGGAAGAKALGISGGDIANFFGFGGGGGKDRRRKIRESLKTAGFTYNNSHSGSWNINKFGDTALENVVKLYENYGNYAVELHNSRKLSNSIASNYSQMEAMVLKLIPGGAASSSSASNNVPVMSIGGGVPGWAWGAAGLIVAGVAGVFFLK